MFEQADCAITVDKPESSVPRSDANSKRGKVMARDAVCGSAGTAAALALAALLSLSGCATPPTDVPTAQSVRGLKPSGNVTMTQVFVSGTGVGSGTLTFKGKTYPFTLVGELIGPGALSTLQASGDVYKLDDLSKFSGAYIQGTGRLAVSTSATGEIWLRNNNGVVMRLTAAQAGITLSTGRYEIFVELAK